MSVGATVRTIALVLLSFSCLSASARAQGVGAIGGTVTDQSGAVLPGATMTLLNPGTIGGNQEAVTDARGTYQFTRLVPGRYSVKAELAGFRPAAVDNLVVNADATARADLKLEIGTLAEGITVKGEAPLLDTTSALNQTVMSREVIDALPGRNDLWNIARMVPAVLPNKYDVGGTEAYQQSISVVHGSVFAENAYLVDGMNTNFINAEGSVTYYYNPFMFQEVNYQTSNGSAERTMGGVVYNMIPKTGTNAWHGSYWYSGGNDRTSSNNLSADLSRRLLAAVPARVLAANPNLVPSAAVKSIWDHGWSFGGPIVRDRLWFVVTGKYSFLDQVRIGSYEPDGSFTPDDNRIRDASLKLSWQATARGQLHFLYDGNNKNQFHRSGNATTDFADGAATWRQSNYWNLLQPKWTMTLSSRMVMDTSASFLLGKEYLPPQADVLAGALPKFDNVLRNHTGAFEYYQRHPGHRDVAQTSVSYVAGSHDVKFGYQFMHVRFQENTWSLSDYPAGLRAVYRNGVPDSVNTYDTPVLFEQFYRNHALYVQDKWTPTRKLTLSLGLRFETFYGWQPAGCQTATAFVSAQCFAAIEGVPDWKMAVPRVSAVYDLFGDGRTALKIAANQYYQPQGTGFTNRINPMRITSDTRSWADANHDLVPQLNELGPSTGFNFGTTNRYRPGIGWPYTAELDVEIERQLPWDSVVSAAYFHREGRNLIGSRNLAVPTSSYIPVTVTEVASGRQVTVFNQDPATRGRFDVLFDNSPDLNSTFDGVDLSVSKRLSHGWMLFGGLEIGRSVGDIFGTSDLNNPNFAFRRGPTAQDVPLSWKLSGSYALPYAITMSLSAQHFTGAPESTTVLVTSNTVPLTQVTQSILVAPAGTTRAESMNQLDLGLRKSVKVGRMRLEPTIDLYNLFNSAAIVSRTTQLGPTYGQPANIQRGRLIRIGAQVNY